MHCARCCLDVNKSRRTTKVIPAFCWVVQTVSSLSESLPPPPPPPAPREVADSWRWENSHATARLGSLSWCSTPLRRTLRTQQPAAVALEVGREPDWWQRETAALGWCRRPRLLLLLAGPGSGQRSGPLYGKKGWVVILLNVFVSRCRRGQQSQEKRDRNLYSLCIMTERNYEYLKALAMFCWIQTQSQARTRLAFGLLSLLPSHYTKWWRVIRQILI